MSRKQFALAAVAGAALLAAGLPAQAQSSSRFAVGANVGTPGLGAQVQYRLAPGLVVRGDADWLKFDRDETWSGVPYDAELKSSTGGLFVDWHPGDTPWLVSAGAYFGERRLDLSSQATGPIEVGGQTFTPAQIGRLEGRAKLSETQPFVGVGWDNTFTTEGAWGFRAIAGVAFSDEPSVRLRAVGGTFSNDPIVQAAVAREEADVRDDAEDYRYYPVLQVGLTRRF